MDQKSIFGDLSQIQFLDKNQFNTNSLQWIDNRLTQNFNIVTLSKNSIPTTCENELILSRSAGSLFNSTVLSGHCKLGTWKRFTLLHNSPAKMCVVELPSKLYCTVQSMFALSSQLQ